MSNSPQTSPLSYRLENLQRKIERIDSKINKFQGIAQIHYKYTLVQYYSFKNPILEMIADVSAEIEDQLTQDEKTHSVDAQLIVDSFNEQIMKIQKLTEEETSMNFIPSVSEIKIEKKLEDVPIIEASDSNFDERFGQTEELGKNFDLKREQSKTLTLLKLAKVDKKTEGSAETLNEHDIQNIQDVISSTHPQELDNSPDTAHEGQKQQEEEVKESTSKKKGWKFNPIKNLIVKPVGAVIRLPGKIVGTVVGGVTHVFSYKTAATTATAKENNGDTHDA